jgi:4-diphosphocytidyl-2-C-methyl-D-erythritol kinase
VKLLCPAKINLFLYVTGRRADGYHDLFSLMCPVGLYDTLVLRFEGRGIRVRCAHPGVPEDESNLAHRAARVFFDQLNRIQGPRDRGLAIDISKHIPVAAGLGGGSSNAAAVLVGLNRHSGHPFSREALQDMALSLGADVPFFVLGTPSLATGVGEVLTPVENLPKFHVLLVNPGIRVSTAAVFKQLNLALTNPQKISKEKFFKARRLDPVRALWNDLETVTASLFPEIHSIKAALLANGADGALMTGSGPTVFGLFYDRQAARMAREALSEKATWRLFLAESIDATGSASNPVQA